MSHLLHRSRECRRENQDWKGSSAERSAHRLWGGPVFSSQTHTDSFQLPVTPSPGDPVPSSGICGHCIHMHKPSCRYTCTHIKPLLKFQKNQWLSVIEEPSSITWSDILLERIEFKVSLSFWQWKVFLPAPHGRWRQCLLYVYFIFILNELILIFEEMWKATRMFSVLKCSHAPALHMWLTHVVEFFVD